MELIQLLAQAAWPENTLFCVQSSDGMLLACESDPTKAVYAPKNGWTGIVGRELGIKPLACDNDTAIVTYPMWRTARDKFLNAPALRLKDLLAAYVHEWPENARYAVQDKTGVVWFVDKSRLVTCGPNGVWRTTDCESHFEILPVADDHSSSRVARHEWLQLQAQPTPASTDYGFSAIQEKKVVGY